MWRHWRGALALACAWLAPALAIGACVTLAQAHATLDHSTPAASANVAAPPRQVDLYFTEPIADPGGATFAVVLDGDGRSLSSNSEGDASDPRHLIVPLNATLDAGSYTVFWKTASASDGGATLGDFSFSVGSAAATPAAATGGQVPVPDTLRTRALSAGGGSNATAWLSGGLIGLVIGAGVMAAIFDLRERRRGRAAENPRRPPGRRR